MYEADKRSQDLATFISTAGLSVSLYTGWDMPFFSPPGPASMGMYLGENGITDSLTTQCSDDLCQGLQKYLSWGDNTMWSGLTYLERRGESMALLTPDYDVNSRL